VLLTMAYTKYPQACKALLAFIMEADQYNNTTNGFLRRRATPATPSMRTRTTQYGLKTQERTVPRCYKWPLTVGGLGSVGEKAANALFDFVLIDMFADYCTGREDAETAIKIAEQQYTADDRRRVVALSISRPQHPNDRTTHGDAGFFQPWA
jgi:multiple sugar transport system substrate-binding protein